MRGAEEEDVGVGQLENAGGGDAEDERSVAFCQGGGEEGGEEVELPFEREAPGLADDGEGVFVLHDAVKHEEVHEEVVPGGVQSVLRQLHPGSVDRAGEGI